MRVAASLERLMTVAEMGAADAAAPECGVPSMTLMEKAGCAVADAIGRRFTPRPTAVLCGPGNNGGDGYVVARLLAQRGWPVWCEALGDISLLKGDAAEAFRRWTGETLPVSQDNPMAGLFVDALFGAGLSRPLEGHAARLAAASARMRDRIVAVDVPSGIHGDTGLALGGIAFHAGLTVTFVRRKPGHLLMPGRAQCGDVVVADIGMPQAACLRALEGSAENTWALAGGHLAPAKLDTHKYRRGHCLVVSGGANSAGAARLAAQGAARAGAGLTTIAADAGAAALHRAHLSAIMVRTDPLADLLGDARRNAVVVGPGLGLDDAAAAQLRQVLEARRASVLDADALTLVARDSGLPLHDRCVATPHEGEFARLYPDIAQELPRIGKLAAARAAARRSGVTILFKGADTVIAAPDGSAAIDDQAPPYLATAGSGDVLAGMIGGLLAQGLPPFDAACAGVFLHGAAARQAGIGMTADDLPSAVSSVLAGLNAAARTG
ncbi:MAG: NAD(P)H-hydrate dehydratase [Alphaproteobacteria bacterium]|nr:NAD(P)H-hydrate dehydratase [Alphaproteobacteria bacterium]